MPSKSKKQHNFMEAIAHSPEFAKKAGVPQPVGKDFAKADKGMKFRKGGSVNPTEQGINRQQTHHGALAVPNVNLNKYIGKKAGGLTNMKGSPEMKKMKETMGPKSMSMDVEAGSNKLTKFGESAVQKRGKTKGTQLGTSGPTKGIQSGAKFAKGGSVSSRADGIAQRGKTKGKMC